ncbi:MAG: carnitine dehydratase [Robiginitomaculum sp.]|nr:MAG: carnitine dehydratase [Robiginitomaculum sp.]
MYDLLKGLRIIECSSFVAAPSAGLYLSQMGAEVIRIDQIGGGPDYRRWPVSDAGDSFYWEGLNKGKKSVALNIRSDEGRQLMQRLATAPGKNAGLLLTNYPVQGFLSHETLSKLRQDQITLRVMGQANGGPALDYTVNSAIGVPYMTGPETLGDEPVNHVLPAWDLITGAYTAFALMAALHHREQTGTGQEVRIPLTDLAISTLGNLGQIAEVIHTNANRPKVGNDVFGAFGRDFVTKDKQRLIIMAITKRQWLGLIDVLEIAEEVHRVEHERKVDLSHSESLRFIHRDLLNPIVASRVGEMNFDVLSRALDDKGGCWGRYQTLLEAVDDPVLVTENPVFEKMENISGITYPVPGAPATLPAMDRFSPKPARKLGADTETVLKDCLEINDSDYDDLLNRGVVGET